MEFKLIEKQAVAKELVEAGKSIFLTGEGGVGKSVTIRAILGESSLLAAPTSIAAINIGGQTLHSLFSLPLGMVVQSDYMKPISKKMKDIFKSGNIKRIIIDEISMVRSDMLDLIDHKLKTILGNGKPFGGMQMVFVGDFFQLSPIVPHREKVEYKKRFGSEFCFASRVWQELNPTIVELSEVMRQEDTTQVSILRSLRKKDKHFEVAVDRINSLTAQAPTEGTMSLCSFKKDAELINNFRYSNNSEQEFKYPSITTGDFKQGDRPVPETVKLKKGCSVIIAANAPEHGYFNGQRGIITDLQPLYVEVEIEDGERIKVQAFLWQKMDLQNDPDTGRLERVISGTFTQMPLLLGYAISVHRAQGMTLGAYNLDLGIKGAFAHGQTYVALSRAKDLSKIHLQLPLRKEDIIVKPEVQEFYESI